MYLRSAFIKRFNPKERTTPYRCEFRNRRRGKGESVEEYGYALNRLAYRDMYAVAREIIIVEQFVIGLGNVDLQRYVQFGHPQTINQAVSLAGEYIAFQGGADGRPRKVDWQDQVVPIRKIDEEINEKRRGSREEKPDTKANTASRENLEIKEAIKRLEKTLQELVADKKGK